MLNNRKALHPVVASILLIIVVVAVGLTVAAWIGALRFSFFESINGKVAYSHVADDAKSNLTASFNCTFYTSLAALPKDKVILECNDFQDFYLQVEKQNVTDIVVYQELRQEHKAAELNVHTLYIEGQFQVWFFVNVLNVGGVAVVYGGYENYHFEAKP